MSGPVTDSPGLRVETYASEIKRSEHIIKVGVRIDFPDGAPSNVFKNADTPRGFDISSISRIEGRLTLDCNTLTIKPEKGSARVYQFNGNSFKSKEPSFAISSAHIFAQYFCEQGTTPTTAPSLRKAVTGKSIIPK